LLDPLLVEKAKLLYESGKSARSISKETGISRGSLSRIINGTRRIQERTIGEFMLPEERDKNRKERCLNCGIVVEMPCVACNTRNYLRHRKNHHLTLRPPEQGLLEIELTGPHLERYLAIRKWRESHPNPHFTDIPENWPWRTGATIF